MWWAATDSGVQRDCKSMLIVFGVAPLRGGEVEEAQIDGLLDLVGAIAEEDHDGGMGLGDPGREELRGWPGGWAGTGRGGRDIHAPSLRPGGRRTQGPRSPMGPSARTGDLRPWVRAALRGTIV